MSRAIKMLTKKVIIVEDSCVARLFLRRIFEDQGFKIVADLPSYKDALKLIKNKELNPDLICLDYDLGDGNGVDLVRYFKKKFTTTKIIFITGKMELHNLIDMYHSGCQGIAQKGDLDSILSLLKAASKDESHFDTVISNKLLSFNFDSRLLSQEEKQTLLGLMSGANVSVLAEKLNIEDRTIFRRKNEIIRKIGKLKFNSYCSTAV